MARYNPTTPEQEEPPQEGSIEAVLRLFYGGAGLVILVGIVGAIQDFTEWLPGFIHRLVVSSVTDGLIGFALGAGILLIGSFVLRLLPGDPAKEYQLWIASLGAFVVIANLTFYYWGRGLEEHLDRIPFLVAWLGRSNPRFDQFTLGQAAISGAAVSLLVTVLSVVDYVHGHRAKTNSSE